MADKQKKSNLIPLDMYFSGATTNTVAEATESGKRKEDFNDESFLKKHKKEEDEKLNPVDEIAEKVRELEEGELPDYVEKHAAETSVKPIEYSEFNRKRKVALLMSYCGAGYKGMQKNPDVETIELKLLEALTAIKAIRPEHKKAFLMENDNQLSFQRSARTDKEVSAARQVVSLKLVAEETFLEDVNKNLPKEIRVFGIERVTKNFDAKCSCSGRSYEYLVPSFAFAPSKNILNPSYRMTDADFERVNSLLDKYVGTHNFHNFTSGKRFRDKSATRFITYFKATKPFVCRSHEFIAIEVSGQSFMIHQIRKMIGLCMAICRGYCPAETIERCYEEPKLDIPKAPGLGLLLCRVYFKQYDKKFGQDGIHNPLTFQDAELEVERFKIEQIWQVIMEEEIKRSSIVAWLRTLINHTYDSGPGTLPPRPHDYKGTNGKFPDNKSNAVG